MKIIIMQKVSIIIPVHNVAPYIEKSLLSALNQTYNNIEYIVVDDCGTDESISIVETIINNNSDKDIRVIHHPHNRGLSAARNTGIINSTGEYLFFMDSDDTIPPDCIEVHIKAIVENDADFTDANTEVIGGRNIFKKFETKSCITSSDIIEGCFSGQIHMTACNKLYKLSFIKKNNIHFIEGLIHEDIIWLFDIAQCAKRVVMIPDLTYHYYIRGGSITTNVSTGSIIKKYNSWNYILSRVIDIAKNTDNKNLLSSISIWMSKIRFKISARIIASDIDDSIKKKYYKEINSENNKIYSLGLFSMLCSMPYCVFKQIFKPLYIIFTYIKTLRS